MAFFDLPWAELENYRPDRHEPTDFDEFWERTFTEHGSQDLDFTLEHVETHMSLIDAFEIAWRGFDGHRVVGWLCLPRGAKEKLPAVVKYTGYSMGRGMSFENVEFALGGYAQFVIDARGQGWNQPSSALGSDDPAVRSSGSVPGFMTDGIMDPETYYYRRLFVDAVRLAEAAVGHELVDEGHVFVTGGSQGGALALATAALARHREVKIAGCAPEVPFLSNFRRAVGLTGANPYQEVVRYLASYPMREEQVFQTLAYFDVMSMAARVEVPGLFSVGLMDEVTPPSTVYAAYNHYAGEKSIEVYRYNGHEGGRGLHTEKIHAWLQRLL